MAFLLLSCLSLRAQMWNGTDTLYGNEWIDYSAQYVKISVANDAVYRLSVSDLGAALPPGLEGKHLKLYHLGVEQALFVSTESLLGADDYLEFVGFRNRHELDRYLYAQPEGAFNPEYSLITDTTAYFLTWDFAQNDPVRYSPTPNDLSNLPAPSPYYQERLVRNYTNSHIKKALRVANVDLQQSYFSDAEGFSTGYGGTGTLRTLDIQPSQIYSGGPAAEMTVHFACWHGSHQQQVRYNGTVYVEDNFSSYQGRKHSFAIANSELQTNMSIEFEGLHDANDKQSVSNITLRYPRNYHFNNQASFFWTESASAQKQYLEISNFSTTGAAPILYDLTNQLRIVCTVEGGIVKVALPPSAAERSLVLVNPSNGVEVAEPGTPFSFTNYSQSDAAFIIVYNQVLATDAGGTDWVQEYADYRQNESPYPMPTIRVEIQELYDQFAYGVQRHPLSIRNFAHFVNKNWSNPSYFFLIGKGREYRSIRTAANLANSLHVNFFIPTFGTPGADNLLLSTNTSATPLFPVGRLAATSAADVEHYLDKVKGFEANYTLPQTIADRAWMKRVMHLGGGITSTEQTLIRNHLASMESLISSNLFGAEVTSFYKESSDPIEVSQSEQLKELINSGISLLSFFGHSSANAFDFNFDNPQYYDNTDRYPLIMSLGCFSGQVHNGTSGIGESFTLTPERGSIGFVASSGYGFVSSLDRFGKAFYTRIGGSHYGQSIGKAIQSSVNSLDLTSAIGDRELAQQTTLQGDPSLRLNPHPGPDYVVDDQSVRFDPTLLNIQLDSFALAFDVMNIGQNLPGATMLLRIEQQLPGGDLVTHVEEEVNAPAFRRSFVYNLPMLGETAVGSNRFFITVNANNAVEELPSAATFNNQLIGPDGQTGIAVFIVSNDVRPIYPPNYSIVSEPTVELKASTAFALAPMASYVMQIDTSLQFNSPLRKEQRIDQGGGVLRWQPGLAFQDSVVYYWRVSPDSTLADGYRWQEHSFIFLSNAGTGWNQSHFYQLGQNDFFNLQLSDDTRKLDYADDQIDVKLQNTIYAAPFDIPRYYIGNSVMASYQGAPINVVPAGVMVAVLDPNLAEPWVNAGDGSYGDDYQSSGFRAFIFRTNNTAERAELINFLENEVPSEHYVALLTVQRNNAADYLPETWADDTLSLGTSIFQVLQSQGASMVQDLATLGSRPYMLFYQKDQPGYPAQETIGGLTGIVQQNSIITGNWFQGRMRSRLIGPASSWESLHWRTSEYEPGTDSLVLSLIGVRPDGSETVLSPVVVAQDTSLQGLSADEYPYLRLELFSSDETNRTSPNLDYWRILHTGVPELGLNAAGEFTFQADTLEQGEPLQLRIGIENLSDLGMDSVLVHYRIRGSNNEEITIPVRMAPLPAGDTLVGSLNFDTRELLGTHQLSIDANPDFDQPELTRINNVAQIPFYVRRDQRNPLLDVTFDGTRILDGDLVSARPLISVALKDENPYLELADTSLFSMLLLYPDGLQRRVHFNEEWVRFYPADPAKLDNQNRAMVELQPEFTLDGSYELFVEARDASGNASGNLNYVVGAGEFGYDYRVRFEVITKAMISEVLNYPNPFSTSTQFVYTLTGFEPPTFFKIQIFTVAGRIVRELTQAELGPLKIGTHRTEYAWDGTDQFGDRLANGVYLYRVVAMKADGQPFETYETGVGAYFKKGFGKMVIIR